MGYSELIKNFQNIRAYMREFYVYGFKSRMEFEQKSARSYDNERRRIENWLGDYVCFRQGANGKRIFLSVDSRAICRNPLHEAFRAKSFTAKDIVLHFYILDALADGKGRSITELLDKITEEYVPAFTEEVLFDESSLRRKLKEYASLGIVQAKKQGKSILYSLTDSEIPLEHWKDAIAFYREADPLGVIGSYLEDRTGTAAEQFTFKHHYSLYALDTEILYQLLTAIRENRKTELILKGEYTKTGFPLKIYISTQTGRQYLLLYRYDIEACWFYRLDNITEVKQTETEPDCESLRQAGEEYSRYLWGVSAGRGRKRKTERLEVLLWLEEGEGYLFERLEREKRNGTIEKVDEHTYRFSVEVYDAMELLPWLRTFIGRVKELHCTNLLVEKRFYEDLTMMRVIYAEAEVSGADKEDADDIP